MNEPDEPLAIADESEPDMVDYGDAKKRTQGAGFGGRVDLGGWPYPP